MLNTFVLVHPHRAIFSEQNLRTAVHWELDASFYVSQSYYVPNQKYWIIKGLKIKN